MPVILILVSLLMFIVYNFRKIKGKLRKALFIVNITLGVLAVLTVALYFANDLAYKSRSRDYRVESGGLLGSMSYLGTEEGYHLVAASGFLSSGIHYAVPEDEVRVSPILKVYRPAMVCFLKSSAGMGHDIMINGRRYTLDDDIVGIYPDYFDLCMVGILLEVAALWLFNFILSLIKFITDIRGNDHDM